MLSSKLLDLTAVPCPLNLVKIKLSLEKLSKNELLIVKFDKGEPEEMILKTLKKMRYQFIQIEEDNTSVKLKILNENR